MFNELHRIIPAPQPEIIEALEASQTTREFYQEVQHRQKFADYCQWYAQTAQENRRDLEKMRGEANIFSWFSRKRM